ncbi:unnamed protein product [Clonostachys rosea]|uniref:F-box domain-containing protein n=1 Tax=Bionectria ochroleuca TaxID=29856 RepID=A0ABY6TQ71_BIOOC|nr:unnamed protein product [Clonostachys rosea]
MSIDTPMARAMALPEILSGVLASLRDQKAKSSLASAARVNSFWFACAADVLWRRVSGAALASIANIADSRRQLYASKIDGIKFHSGEKGFTGRPLDLCFARINSAGFDSYELEESIKVSFKQRIQPGLERSVFNGEEYLDEKLQLESQYRDLGFESEYRDAQLENEYPHIHALMNNLGKELTDEALLQLISQTKSLRDLSLCCGSFSCEIFFCVSELKDLSALSWSSEIYPVTPELLSETVAQNPNPFPSLGSFSSSCTSKAISDIATMLSRLTKINLGLRDSEHDVLGPLSTIESLRQVECTFKCSHASLSGSQLLSLKSLSKLEMLIIWFGDDSDHIDITTSPFSDAEFHELVSALPGLHNLRLGFGCDLTGQALLSLSAKCPDLARFEMPRGLYCDLNTLLAQAGKRPLLPHLEVLDAGRILTDDTDDEAISDFGLARQIRKYFPKLESLCVENTKKRDGCIIEAFDELAWELDSLSL